MKLQIAEMSGCATKQPKTAVCRAAPRDGVSTGAQRSLAWGAHIEVQPVQGRAINPFAGTVIPVAK